MADFYITNDQDTIAYFEPIIEYGYYELIPSEKWNGQSITPPLLIGRDPKHFCKKVRVYKGRLHTSPTMYIVDVEFDKPMNLEKLQKDWKSNPPKFETFKNVKVINKKKIDENLYV
jgi:hypothetical protein